MTTPPATAWPPNVEIVQQPASQPYRYGLYSAATVLNPTDTRWEIGGVIWSPDTCAQGDTWPGGICLPSAIPGTWTLTTSSATGTPIVVTQPDASGRPFDVAVQLPDKGAGKTLTSIVVDWGTSQMPPTELLGDHPNPQQQLHITYPEAAGSYVLTVTYHYDDDTNAVSTITLTWTGSGPTERSKASWPVDWDFGTPFLVYNSVNCAPVGFTEAALRAQNRLSWNEPRLVEAAFWRGLEGNRPFLAGSESVPVTDVTKPGVDIVTALGLLEYVGQREMGTELTIHAPRFLAAMAADHYLVCQDGNGVLRTPLGNRWAFGAGYDFTGPDGQVTAETAWMYATGPVVIRRGPLVEPREVFNQFVNQRVALAERMVVVTAECAQFAAKVAAPGLANAVIPPETLPVSLNPMTGG